MADGVLRRLLAVVSVCDRATVLLMLGTGLRLSEVADLRPGALRPTRRVKVRGKGSNERVTPLGSTVRQAIVRTWASAARDGPTTRCSSGRKGEISTCGLQHMVRRLKGGLASPVG